MTTRPDTDAPTWTGHSQRSSIVPESHLEKMLNDGVRRAGGMSFKMAPTTSGLPDRMVLWPGGRIELVELKTEKGKTRRIQEIWHYRMAELGTEVIVVRGISGVQDYLASKQQAVSA